jgi:acyl-CoA reductase-like NAD-dependent aldehyde dehydrogenase
VRSLPAQTCIMGARLLVHESIAEEVTRKFVAKAASIRCGPPSDVTTQMGPVISKAQLAKVCFLHSCVAASIPSSLVVAVV